MPKVGGGDHLSHHRRVARADAAVRAAEMVWGRASWAPPTRRHPILMAVGVQGATLVMPRGSAAGALLETIVIAKGSSACVRAGNEAGRRPLTLGSAAKGSGGVAGKVRVHCGDAASVKGVPPPKSWPRFGHLDFYVERRFKPTFGPVDGPSLPWSCQSFCDMAPHGMSRSGAALPPCTFDTCDAPWRTKQQP